MLFCCYYVFDPELVKLKSQKRNMLSASEQPEVVRKYLADEVAAKRVIKVGAPEAAALPVHRSPFGVIPKKRKNRWRLIQDLSAPEGNSVNDGIAKELASLSYMSIDDVVGWILELGKGTQLTKMDIQQAYRNVPVHPEDRLLLGMTWEDETYIDAALPFGLRSAPMIFSAIADAVQWVMQKRGVKRVSHYIDDYVAAGPPGSDECARNKVIMHDVCEELGFPVEGEKDEGPASTLDVLGLELDTEALEIRLPPEKLQRIRASLASWRGRKACRKRELLSLIGVLSHASKAVRAGRSFLRRLIDLASSRRRLDMHIRLNREAQADVEWWYRYVEAWNGTAMMFSRKFATSEFTLTSDASGNWGCGAYSGNKWFMLRWAGPIQNLHITVKELAPVVVAAAIWGREWSGKSVHVLCDNSAVVGIINSGASKNPEAMQLRRCLAFLAAKWQFHPIATHIKGTDNILADALSRDNVSLFRTLYPQANAQPSAIPEEVLDLLYLCEPDWTSKSWTDQWNSTFGMA